MLARTPMCARACVCVCVCMFVCVCTPLFSTQPSDHDHIWHADRLGNGAFIKQFALPHPRGGPRGRFRGKNVKSPDTSFNPREGRMGGRVIGREGRREAGREAPERSRVTS